MAADQSTKAGQFVFFGETAAIEAAIMRDIADPKDRIVLMTALIQADALKSISVALHRQTGGRAQVPTLTPAAAPAAERTVF